MMKRAAQFSPCRRYRYSLWRSWPGMFTKPGYVMFVGLNPSTADEVLDDPTIRRCVGYVRQWGYASLCMTNLFAYRATDPAEMMAADDPVGPENDKWMTRTAVYASVIVAAWGVHGTYRCRDTAVRRLIPAMRVLRLTKDGHPAHPLYLPKGLDPVPWPD